MYRSLAVLLLGTIIGVGATRLQGQITMSAGRDFGLPRVEVSFTYSPTGVQSPPGTCGCFFMNGVSAEGNFRTYRAFTTVLDVTATHTGNIRKTGEPFSMIMVTGGIRLNYRIGGQRFHYFKPFFQALAGVAHGFDGAFPDQAGFIQPSANSFALLAGMGVDYKWRRHLSFRVIQADYGYARLRNLDGNDQNLLRISAGITIHLK